MAIGRFYGGIAALIWSPERGQYLLLKRSAEKDYGAGCWECVTGRVDQGEGFEEAVHREVREELEVEVEIEFFVGTTHFYRGEPVPENELLGVVYCCSVAEPGAVRLSWEHSELRWVTPEEAAALLTAEDASTRWLRRTIKRAEGIRRRMPKGLWRYCRDEGFCLDS
jgi:8-oxo-dGTP pyrophosphatase MutT (NUDIX family)